jgi:hypothetical protein
MVMLFSVGLMCWGFMVMWLSLLVFLPHPDPLQRRGSHAAGTTLLTDLVEKWFLLKTFLIIWLRAEQNQGVYGYVVFSRYNVLGVHGYVAFVTSFFTSPRPSPKEREPCRRGFCGTLSFGLLLS